MAENKTEVMNIGLDIGANSIKAVSITPAKSGFNLNAIGISALENDSTENGFVADYGELVHGIEDVMDQGFSNEEPSPVAVALKGPAVFMRRVSIHCENVADIREIFPWIIDQYVCLDPEEMTIDFDVLGEGSRYGHLSVLVIGAKKDTVTDIVSVIESSKLIPKVIEPEALSLTRLFRAVSPVIPDTCLILHVGSVGSIVVFVANGHFSGSSEIDMGGRMCTDILVNKFNMDPEDAEGIKRDPDSHNKGEAIKEALINEFCIPFTEKIDNSIAMYEYKGGSSPYKIMLSGGACEMFGLSETLTEKFSVPVEYLDPWKIVHLTEESETIVETTGRYTYNIAIGLALTGRIY